MRQINFVKAGKENKSGSPKTIGAALFYSFLASGSCVIPKPTFILMLCLFILEFSLWFVKVSVFVSSYMDHTGGLRDYLERNNCNEL